MQYDKGTEENKIQNSELFLNKIKNTKYYLYIKDLMKQWKQQKHKGPKAFTLFTRLVKYINQQGNKQLLDQFNKCLVKQATIPKKSQIKERCKTLLVQNNNSEAVLDKFINEYQVKNTRQIKQIKQSPPEQKPIQKYEEINEQTFVDNFQNKKNFQPTLKILQLYINGIITVKQFKNLIIGTIPKNQQLYLIQAAIQIQSSRRKSTNFVPLNQLSETSFIQRMGMSYVTMPNCYASRCNDKNLDFQIKKVLNKKWVSVPFGSQHMSFTIIRKNTYQQELFKNQEQKFQIDHTLIILRKALKQIQQIEQKKQMKDEYPLIERILTQIYGYKQPYLHLKKNPQIACILKLRIQQKLKQLQRCRQKALKSWQQVHIKNFYKSLDQRSFYFRKNDKKFNCIPRWEKQMQFRMNYVVKLPNQIIQNRDNYNQKLNQTLDSFQNITRQKCFESKQIKFQQKGTKQYDFPPPYQNKVLFVMQFDNLEILKQLCTIIFKHTSRKNIFQFLMVKIFNISIKDIFQQKNYKFWTLFKQLESKLSNKQIVEEIQQQQFLITRKQKKKNINQNQQLYQLIEEQIMPINVIQPKTPFEGPSSGRVFIGTKSHYYFIRYLLTLYQRFLKAKEMTSTIQDQRQQIRYSKQQAYQLFKLILSYKIKDTKFEQYLNRIYGKNAFLFFTMDKLIMGIVKLINNFDDLSNSIAKQDTKDYQLQIRKYQKFTPKGQLHQLLRVYHQDSNFFRFSFSNSIMYINSWVSIYKNLKTNNYVSNVNAQFSNLIYQQISEDNEIKNRRELKRGRMQSSYNSEYFSVGGKYMVNQKGEDYINIREKYRQELEFELRRRKKIKLT